MRQTGLCIPLLQPIAEGFDRFLGRARHVSGGLDYAATGITQAAVTGGIIRDPSLLSDAISLGGPGQLREVTFNAISAYVEQSFGKKTHVQLAYNHQDYDFEAYQAGASAA